MGKGTIIQGRRVRDTWLPDTNSLALNRMVPSSLKKRQGVLDHVAPRLNSPGAAHL